jgi:von Willebrand factor type A domain/Aerotolerance regulator N-terminal
VFDVTFLTALALAAAALIVAPYLAHRLRRRNAEEQPFPPARLVEATRPHARRRSRLEDRALLATRAAAVLALAVLGATPLLRCSRLSLQRAGGASVAMAIVVDDSMSMRASFDARKSRFERARQGGLELLASAREGDAVALVLAGSPARVALAATTDLGAARNALEMVSESDRATDLDGALALARGLLLPLPQIDRRIVVLSDLADGLPDAPPLGDASPVPVWIALPELRSKGVDCAVMRADRSGARVRVETHCGPGASAAGRDIVVEDAHGSVLGRGSAGSGPTGEVTVLLPVDDANPAAARLLGTDAVAADDIAPVLPEATRAAIAVVADSASETVATGGAPIAEQALSALKLDVDVRPIPAFPDRAEDLSGTLGVLLDDPPGLTPEQRRALATYLEGGGVLLLALGPRAAAAPLGASFEPVLVHAVAWSETTSPGGEPATAAGELAASAESLVDLGAPRRSVLAPDDVSTFEPLVTWTDGAPLVSRRSIGRGGAWVVSLPVSLDASDLALRPAFLALLRAWEREAHDREAAKRSEVGSTWRFPGAGAVELVGPAGAIVATRDDTGMRAVPPRLGLYRVTVDGQSEARVATPSERELDLRPRAAASTAAGDALGHRRASVDVSGQVALVLLAATALEMALRVRRRPREA